MIPLSEVVFKIRLGIDQSRNENVCFKIVLCKMVLCREGTFVSRRFRFEFQRPFNLTRQTDDRWDELSGRDKLPIERVFQRNCQEEDETDPIDRAYRSQSGRSDFLSRIR